jgi:hypothetical protein
MATVNLVVSTRKGVFLFRSDASRKSWDSSGPFVQGIDVNHAVMDPRNGTVYATANDPWFGPQVKYSRAMGETWIDAKSHPRFAGDPAPQEGPDAVPWFFQEQKVIDRCWQITPGETPETLYCGVAPAALFKSTDGGATWKENMGLSNHETRPTWQPGAGGMCLHSIVQDPADARRMWIAISAAGVFRTEDGGESWQTAAQGIRSESAAFDPNIELYPAHGQCVHHIEKAPGAGQRLYAQAHLGTYRSDDGGNSWVDITAGLPSEFGLTMTLHPRDPETMYTFPLVGGEFRVPPEGKMAVWRTQDSGKTWKPLTNGFPKEKAFMGVYRQALTTDKLDPAGVYVGTNTGQLYASANEGERFELITANLPPIDAVSACVIE